MWGGLPGGRQQARARPTCTIQRNTSRSSEGSTSAVIIWCRWRIAGIFVQAGCTNVRTYIQSGNVIFSAPTRLLKRLPDLITERIRARFGFPVPILIRSVEQLAGTIRDNPFLQAGESEKTLYVLFLADLPNELAIGTLDPARSAPDAFHVREQEIYLHLPNGAGRSKLTNAYFDTKLSTVCTARNWATVRKLFEMMQA